MRRLTAFFAAAAVGVFWGSGVAAQAAGAAPGFVFQQASGLPVTAFNLTFRVGSADDPQGQAGLAALTAGLVREGGVRSARIGDAELPARSRAELEDFLYPMAADIRVSVENEQTSFEVTTTAEDSVVVFRVLAQMLTRPDFNKDELERLRGETLDALEKQLPREDEEELGKAALDQSIYGRGHPYGHVVLGTVKSLRELDRDAVEKFYASHYARRRLTIGLAGVVSPELDRLARTVFSALPEGTTDRAEIPAATTPSGLSLKLVKGSFDAVGVHLGAPIPINRASPDFPDMFLASWAFGKHRSFVGRLMHEVREVRGLNYGDYSYAEYFPHGGEFLSAPTQASRARQAFTVWGRPTPPENGCFLVRELLRETNSLATRGLNPREFELARSHLVGNAPLLATGLESRLGYAIDSRFYGIEGDYLLNLQRAAKRATRARVNGAIKKYLAANHFDLVVVGADTDRLKTELLGRRCEIHYAHGVQQTALVHQQDAEIGAYPVPVRPENTTTVTAESVFAE